jgi:signal transduction histidine kinase
LPEFCSLQTKASGYFLIQKYSGLLLTHKITNDFMGQPFIPAKQPDGKDIRPNEFIRKSPKKGLPVLRYWLYNTE